jgi:CBS domain-containing protein
MIREHVHRVVVVDADDHPTGIVTTMDILSALDRGDAVQYADPTFDARVERHGPPASVIPDRAR